MEARQKWRLVKGLAEFVRVNKLWIITPILIDIVLTILAVVFIETPSTLPFIYALF